MAILESVSERVAALRGEQRVQIGIRAYWSSAAAAHKYSFERIEEEYWAATRNIANIEHYIDEIIENSSR